MKINERLWLPDESGYLNKHRFYHWNNRFGKTHSASIANSDLSSVNIHVIAVKLWQSNVTTAYRIKEVST